MREMLAVVTLSSILTSSQPTANPETFVKPQPLLPINIMFEKQNVERNQEALISYLDEAGQELFSDEEFKEEFFDICADYEIEPELIIAMINAESTFNPQAVSSASCKGLMQINPKWHKERMEKLEVTDLFDPISNIKVGIDYISELIEECDGDVKLALMSYNMGTSKAKTYYNSYGYSKYAIKISDYQEELNVFCEIKNSL